MNELVATDSKEGVSREKKLRRGLSPPASKKTKTGKRRIENSSEGNLNNIPGEGEKGVDQTGSRLDTPGASSLHSKEETENNAGMNTN